MMQKVMEEAIWRSVCDNCPSLSSLSTNDGDGTGKNLANIGPGSSCVIPSTALTNSVKRQPSLKDHGHMLHFDNFRTFYTNGSLTLVVNDLNLDKVCYDPRKVTPWPFSNTMGLINFPQTLGQNLALIVLAHPTLVVHRSPSLRIMGFPSEW
ncbi:hypothetical protein ACFX14_037740 [Malus domestica]